MLPKRNRIPTEEFPRVLRGKTYQDEILRVVFCDENKTDRLRGAIIVPKKQATTAVMRNHIRRFLYRLLSEHQNELPLACISLSIKKKHPTDEELKHSFFTLCLKK